MKLTLPDIRIKELVKLGFIKNFTKNSLQPASIDLSLSDKVYRIKSGFLTGNKKTVQECLVEMGAVEFSLKEGIILETGCAYLIPVQEELDLPNDIYAIANPKSSTGRIDVFVRLVTDYSIGFDYINSNYKGQLYLEVCPITFPIFVNVGSRLAQLRFLKSYEDESIVKNMHYKELPVSIELKEKEVVAYRAKHYCYPIEVDKENVLSVDDYWDILEGKGNKFMLEPGEFYIMSSMQRFDLLANEVGDILPFDAFYGEFRVHYAGFFDPGFGNVQGGSSAVLEIRCREVPFSVYNGQDMCVLRVSSMLEDAEILYGSTNVSSHYQGQRLTLSKHFRKE